MTATSSTTVAVVRVGVGNSHAVCSCGWSASRRLLKAAACQDAWAHAAQQDCAISNPLVIPFRLLQEGSSFGGIALSRVAVRHYWRTPNVTEDAVRVTFSYLRSAAATRPAGVHLMSGEISSHSSLPGDLPLGDGPTVVEGSSLRRRNRQVADSHPFST